MMSWTMDARELAGRLRRGEAVAADCRFVLGRPEAGRGAYDRERIPGAVYFDLERDLSGPVGPHGGRHPLPDPNELAAKLGRAGIGPDTTVVAYDEQGGAMAARFWWLLRYLGHDRAAILDGGFGAWRAAGLPTEGGNPRTERSPARFDPRPRPHMLASVEDVRGAVARGDAVLIDSRESARYAGELEPIDPVAGHIPGAINRFWKDTLRTDGTFLGEAELRERFADLDPERETIVYCGSGVTACPNVMALERAGFRRVKLYAGSWSDWISYPENPVATGKE